MQQAFLFLQSVPCPAQALCTNLMMYWTILGYFNSGTSSGTLITGISGWLRAAPLQLLCTPVSSFWCPTEGQLWTQARVWFNSVTQTFFSEHIPGPWSHFRRSGIGRSDFWTSPLCFFKILVFNLGRNWWKGKGHSKLFQLSLLEHQDC